MPPGAAQCTLQAPARSQITQPSVNLTLQLDTSLHVTRHPFRQSTLQALARLQVTAQSSPHESEQLETSAQISVQRSTHWPPQLEERAQSTAHPASRQTQSHESKSRQTHVPFVHPSHQSPEWHPNKTRNCVKRTSKPLRHMGSL